MIALNNIFFNPTVFTASDPRLIRSKSEKIFPSSCLSVWGTVNTKSHPRYKFLRKPILLNRQKYLNTPLSVFRKEETKGYVILNLKIDVANVDYV